LTAEIELDPPVLFPTVAVRDFQVLPIRLLTFPGITTRRRLHGVGKVRTRPIAEALSIGTGDGSGPETQIRHLEPQRRKGHEGKQEIAMRTTSTLAVNIVIEARH
jgi:hypothetical protein